MNMTRDQIIKEFFEKGISPTLNASGWKQRPAELLDLAVQAKLLKVHLIIENSQELQELHRNELRFIGKQWVILR